MGETRRIGPRDAFAKVQEGYTYIDVRTQEEFDQGHPPGAVNIPIAFAGPSGMAPNPDFVSVVVASFAKDAKLVVGCKAGGRSKKACDALAQAGFRDLFDQYAGWDGARDSFGKLAEPGWSRVGLASETGSPPGRSYEAMRGKTR
jgi:rhodanese-related sulfurtransferase